MILAPATPIASNVCMFALHAPFPPVVHDTAGTRQIDRAIIDNGTPGFQLMMRAAQATLDLIRRLPASKNDATGAGLTNMVVLAGSGNNGGDGYGLGALACLAGFDVTILGYGTPTGDAALARDFCTDLGLKINDWTGTLPPSALYIDALLGIGLNRAPDGPLADIIKALNAAHQTDAARIIALDIPSGLDADTGNAYTPCSTAHHTVTFLTLKAGILTGDGPDRCGEVHFSDLGHETRRAPAVARLLTPPTCLAMSPAATAHKGTRGSAALLAGVVGMEGAGQLAGLASLRAGAGKVFWATPENTFDRPPELIILTPDDLLAQLDTFRVCIAGPGLGDGFDTHLETIWHADIPLVLDADGLRWLARAQPAARHAAFIATPHPGEARALAPTPDPDRFAQLASLRAHYGGTWVLKGAGTLISGEMTTICPFADGRLGTAGAGDVLAGIIGGLWSQHHELAADQIAQAGVYVHTHAARTAINARAGHSIIAGDVLDALGEAHHHARNILSGHSEIWSAL